MSQQGRASLSDLRSENLAAWERSIHLPDYTKQCHGSSARYIPALEDEVDRLRALAGEPPLTDTEEGAP